MVFGDIRLTGANTFSGTTTLPSSGSSFFTALTVSSDASLGAGTTKQIVANHAGSGILFLNTFTTDRPIFSDASSRLQFSNWDPDNVVTLNGVISGSTPSVRFDSGGTYYLKGDNVFTAGISIKDDVTIKLDADSGLGDGGNISTGDGGDVEIQTTASFTTTRDINMSDITGSLTLSPIGASNVLTWNGNILAIYEQYEVGLTKSNSGTLVLGGTNTYFHGTTITEGTLKISSNSNLGDASGGITFSGDSNLTTTSGITLVSTRGITIGTGVTASIQNDDTSNPTTIAGNITGAGGLIKKGSGELILSGTNNYTGSTSISSGALIETGSLSTSSSVDVGANGTLKGTGSIGPVTNTSGGTVAPGASIGTLTITGNYTQNASSTLEIEINPAGATDLLSVSGIATLAGTLNVLPTRGIYVPGTTYRFLTAGTVTNTFTTLVENSPATFSLTYGATYVDLTVTVGTVYLPVPTEALRGNSRRVADYLFANNFVPSNSDLFNVINQLTGLPAGYYELALMKISPIIYAALAMINLQNDVRISHLLHKPFRSLENEKIDKLRRRKFSNNNEKKRRVIKKKTFLSEQKNSLWAEPIFFSYNQETSNGRLTDEGQAAFDANTYGTGIGWSRLFGEQWMLNLGGGYTFTKIYWGRGLGNGKFNSIYLAPSFGMITDRATAYVLLQSSVNFYQMNRKIHYGSLQRVATNRHNSYDALAQVGGSYRLQRPTSNFILSPEGECNYLVVCEQGYEEGKAGSLNLHVKRNASVFVETSVNLRLIREIYSKAVFIAPQIYVGWIGIIPVANNKVVANFIVENTSRQTFYVRGYEKMTNQITLGFNVPIENYKGLTFDAGYQASFLSRFQIYQVTLKIDWNF